MRIDRTMVVEEITETAEILKVKLKSVDPENFDKPEGAWNWAQIALPLTERGKVLVNQKVQVALDIEVQPVVNAA
jgi:hypothetical protein